MGADYRVTRGRLWTAGSIVLLAVVLIASLNISFPYFIWTPGSAENLQPLVRVSGGHRTSSGALMLTTVLEIPASNLYMLLYGLLRPNHELWPAREVSGGLSVRQYLQVENYMMATARQGAVVAALRYLHKPVAVKTAGYEVITLDKPRSDGPSVLKPGDLITRIAGVSLARDPAALLTILHNARIGSRLPVGIVRNGRAMRVSVPIVNLSPKPGQTLPGIGIITQLAQTVRTPIRIRIDSGGIDGPSAGLMFALEVINQLWPHGDLTHGYKIAGTGTIDAKGNVGQIGGARLKVLAAYRAGARYFFVPKDLQPGDNNESHAEAEARALHGAITVVPVATLGQAVAFLRSLP
jgi:PDZ domain-containing protein